MTWPTKTDFVDGDVLTATQVNNIGTNLNLFDPTSATLGQVPVADGAGSVAWGAVAAGLSLITPTSINFTGTSATINASGTVSFTACSVLSLNGIFSASYDNYLMILTGSQSASGGSLAARLRASGTDNSAASSYKNNYFTVNAGTINASSGATTYWDDIAFGGANHGYQFMIYRPFAAVPTCITSYGTSDYTNAFARNTLSTHNASTSFDGFSWRQDLKGTTITGIFAVYGIRS